MSKKKFWNIVLGGFDDRSCKLRGLAGSHNNLIHKQKFEQSLRCKLPFTCKDFDLCGECRLRRIFQFTHKFMKPSPPNDHYRWYVIRVASKVREPVSNIADLWKRAKRESSIICSSLMESKVLSAEGTCYTYDLEYHEARTVDTEGYHLRRPVPAGWSWTGSYLCKTICNPSDQALLAGTRDAIHLLRVNGYSQKMSSRYQALARFCRFGRRGYQMPLLSHPPEDIDRIISARPANLRRLVSVGSFREILHFAGKPHAESCATYVHWLRLMETHHNRGPVDPAIYAQTKAYLESSGFSKTATELLLMNDDVHVLVDERLHPPPEVVQKPKRPRQNRPLSYLPDEFQLDKVAYEFLSQYATLQYYPFKYKWYERPWLYLHALLRDPRFGEIFLGNLHAYR